jgi:hypothetical protein
MKKLLTMAIIASTIAITTMPAQAALKSNTLKSTTSTPTLAILDTALDTSIPSIRSRVVAEVCILDWPSCPNKKNFMEGPGSSVLPMSMLSTSSFNHGTQMASAAIAANPNINIVFVRIVGNTARGAQQTYGLDTLVNALAWVNNNKAKYNIVAVASSHATNVPVIKRSADTAYCLPTSVDTVVSDLNKSGVPVFFPAGNSGGNPSMKNKIEWPGCISQSIAVGGVETLNLDKPQVSLISNYDAKLVDLWGEVQQPTIYPGNVSGYSYGTSVSVQVIAAKYVQLKVLKPTLTSAELISLMKTASSPVENSYGQNIYLFSLSKVING